MVLNPGIAHVQFRQPLVDPSTRVNEAAATSFGDLVRMLAEGIADAQASLDRTSAELVAEFANTKVDIVPRITETIDEDGNISFEQSPAQSVSLLDIGVVPTFYQFSEATVEAAMDLRIVENETESGDGKKRVGLFAETYNLRFDRKMNRDIQVTSKVTAKLVPVPRPLRLEPSRVTETPNG